MELELASSKCQAKERVQALIRATDETKREQIRLSGELHRAKTDLETAETARSIALDEVTNEKERVEGFISAYKPIFFNS